MPSGYQRARRYVLAALGIDRQPRTADVLYVEAGGRHDLDLIEMALTVTEGQGLVESYAPDGGGRDVVVWCLTDAGIVQADERHLQMLARRARREARQRTATPW